MKEIRFKITGIPAASRPVLTIDGTPVRLKKKGYGFYDGCFRTEKEVAEIALSARPELSGRLWWLTALITFLLSVFGIFEPPYGKKCFAADLGMLLPLKEDNEIELAFRAPSENGRAADVFAPNVYTETENICFTDKKAKRRRRIVFAVKALSWLCIAFAAVYLTAKGI